MIVPRGWTPVAHRVRAGIERAFAEQHTPREIAASFAFGVFVTAMPTGGTALVLFFVLAYCFDRVSKIALVASLVVFNPVVKWSVYAASFWLGNRLLGPVPLGDASSVTVSFGGDLVARQLLGNTILAAVFAVIGYGVVLLVVTIYRRRETHPVDAFSELPSR